MLALNTAPVRFTPSWLLGQDGLPRDGAPVYLIKPATVVERALLEGELEGPPWNAGDVHPARRLLIMHDGVRNVWEGDERGQALQALSDEGQRTGGEPDPVFVAVEEMLRQCWPPYAKIVAQLARREQGARMLSAMKFLRGWEGLEFDYRAGSDGLVDQALLQKIDPDHLSMIGLHAYRLMYGLDTRPLSQPPSPSAGDPPTSKSKRRRRAAGTSTAAGGAKTPAT